MIPAPKKLGLRSLSHALFSNFTSPWVLIFSVTLLHTCLWGCSSRDENGRGGRLSNVAGANDPNNEVASINPSGPQIEPMTGNTNPSEPVTEAPLDPCTPEGTCPDTAAGEPQVCTIADVCGPVGIDCTPDAPEVCTNDTYCCASDCRKDGGAGVCIPGRVLPGPSACVGNAVDVGIFSPSIQCEWRDAQFGNVMTTPLVGDLPNDSGESGEIIVVGGRTAAGDSLNDDNDGRLKIINAQTCETVETVTAGPSLWPAATPAIGDLDGDGIMEIVARVKDNPVGGLAAFKWNGNNYEVMWTAAYPNPTNVTQPWDGVSIHDLDDDGQPEVLLERAVYNGQSGNLITAGPADKSKVFNGLIPVVGDLDGDGIIELIAKSQEATSLYQWVGNEWALKFDFAYEHLGGPTSTAIASHYAFADFGSGTPGAWNPQALDGIAEVIGVSDSGEVRLWTINKEDTVIAEFNSTDRGGPPNVGDFDNDGLPEIAVAGATRLRVLDLACSGTCTLNALWETESQDASSGQTGATIFDFDGDQKAELVYADECFLRVYEGNTGRVLFSSARRSPTWYESPVVADPDKDQNTELLVNSAGNVACPTPPTPGRYYDPSHDGVPCLVAEDCIPAGRCEAGLCRCGSDADCDTGLGCAATPAGGANACRAFIEGQSSDVGLTVLRDRLDRWASSRPLWNQHAYSVTNINDDGTIPRTSEWQANFAIGSSLNNYRQNRQGKAAATDLPDITGSFNEDNDTCVVRGTSILLNATVCNRGKRAVGAALPATFYEGAPEDGKILCTSFTSGQVPTGGCLRISCSLEGGSATGLITMVANDDGKGGRNVKECNTVNNTSTKTIADCEAPR